MYCTSLTSLAHETYKQNIYWLRHSDNDNNLEITIRLVKKYTGQIFYLKTDYENQSYVPNRRDNYQVT